MRRILRLKPVAQERGKVPALFGDEISCLDNERLRVVQRRCWAGRRQAARKLPIGQINKMEKVQESTSGVWNGAIILQSHGLRVALYYVCMSQLDLQDLVRPTKK